MGLFRPGTSIGRPKTALPDQTTLRGRISGPIPMDDEFPIRHPGSGIAHEGHPERVESIMEERPVSRYENTPMVTRGDKLESVTPSGPSQASNASASPRQQRTIRSSTLRYSTVSDSTDIDRPQRKKSTLKSTLGRLFKRKKKSTSEPFPEGRLIESGDSAQHENDPNRIFKESEPKRSASLPITEYDRALRSHSVGPDDMLAINSARNSLQVDPSLLRRRAASSNRILSGRIRDFDGELIGLSPRPASTHGRDNHPHQDPEDIGRAITSDSRTHRRRSRSLSQLQEVAVSQVHIVRKRSDEIRYWRESYTAPILSPNSSTINNDNDDTAVADVDMDVEVNTQPDSPQQLSPKTPPQPFNFGPMVGMKITQAASLEDRIASLEVHNQKLERLVSQLFQVVPGVHNYVPDTPLQAPPRSSLAQSAIYTPARSAATETSRYGVSVNDTEQSSRFSNSRQSNESFGDGNTFIGSVPPSTVPQPRPTSNVTIRGAASLPALLGENAGPFTIDQYTTLKALIDTERDARQVLEDRVTKLNRRLELLSRTNHKLETASTTYSTVSAFEHDDDDEPLTAGGDTDSEAFKTPREEESGHGFGAFGEELRDEEQDGSRKKAARTLSLSQLTLKRPPLPPQPQTPAGVDL